MKEKPYHYLFSKKRQTCKKVNPLLSNKKSSILNRKIYFGNPYGGTVEYMSYNTKVHTYIFVIQP